MAERRVQYRTLDHKADIGFLVEAPSWERLYVDAALALTDIRVQLDRISERDRKVLKVSADEREALMVGWLNEILFLFEKEHFLARRIVFSNFDLKTINATVWGEHYDPLKHGSLSEIKAATYHQLEIGETEKPEHHFYARIFLDL